MPVLRQQMPERYILRTTLLQSIASRRTSSWWPSARASRSRLGEITELGGGRVQVAGALVSLEDESVLCSFTVDLVRNNSMFGYAISGLDIL